MILDHSPYALIPEPAPPALPARRTSFTDAAFNTLVVRLTDATDGAVNRISYGIWPAFNCDYTRILIQCDAAFKIVQWNPASMVFGADIALPGFQGGPDATWSHTDPNVLYHRDGTSKLMQLNVSTMVDTLVYDFASAFPGSPYLARMSSSSDDNIWCFARQTTGYVYSGFVVLNISANTIYHEPASRAGNYFKVQIDKTGRWMWNVATDPNSEWWDLNQPNTQTTVLTPGTGHSAVLTGLQAQYNNTTNQDDLITLGGAFTGPPMISWPDWTLLTEYSGSDANESWYAATAASQPSSAPAPLHNELLQIATDGSGSVRRLCHLQNVLTIGDYDSEPQPACGYGAFPWIAFHSNWGSPTRRDVFLVNAAAVLPPPPPTPPAVVIPLAGAVSIYSAGPGPGSSPAPSTGGPQPLSYYQSLLTQQWRLAPKMNAWLAANLQLFQDVIICAEEFQAAFTPGIASGPQLDVLGNIVGCSRTVNFQPSDSVSPVLDDQTFTLLILATIMKNHWDGQLDSLIAIWNALFPGGGLTVVDHQNMTVDLYASGPANSIQQDLVTHGYLLPRPQAVEYIYHWAALPMLGFDANTAYEAGFDTGFFT